MLKPINALINIAHKPASRSTTAHSRHAKQDELNEKKKNIEKCLLYSSDEIYFEHLYFLRRDCHELTLNPHITARDVNDYESIASARLLFL